MHPVLQALAGVLGIALLAALFFFSLVFFAVFAGIALVAGLIMWVRLRWLMWRGRRTGTPDAGLRRDRPSRSGDAIEGEFVVIEREHGADREAD